MKLLVYSISIMLLFCLGGVRAAQPGTSALKAGDRAPDFQLPGSDGKTYTLKQFAGKKAVLIAWFPKAFTGG